MIYFLTRLFNRIADWLPLLFEHNFGYLFEDLRIFFQYYFPHRFYHKFVHLLYSGTQSCSAFITGFYILRDNNMTTMASLIFGSTFFCSTSPCFARIAFSIFCPLKCTYTLGIFELCFQPRNSFIWDSFKSCDRSVAHVCLKRWG